jgi:hypothetical protein
LPASLIATSENLDRAWQWVRSSTERGYKAYFRESYAAFAIADREALVDLRQRLSNGSFEPSHSTKLFIPKPSGILRPISLLAVEDQIVFQAHANLIAERIFRRVRQDHMVRTFSHLYAGKSSLWFYRKWIDGYKAFSSAIKGAVDDGFDHTASFDLTAFYDSLDHGVLKHFLQRMGFDSDFIGPLTRHLSKWTATSHKIYQNHGIPQGPLASGLIAELVMTHFDEAFRRNVRVRYLRYVDDIRLFAKNEHDLRQALVRLDVLSKAVGLFPQSSKIDIHRVIDIKAEMKDLSNPADMHVRRTPSDQATLRSRLQTLSRRFAVADVSRFKYLLAQATPNAALSKRLWRIYRRQPALYRPILEYFSRYERLPKSVSSDLVQGLKDSTLYPAVSAAILSVLCERLREPSQQRVVDSVVRERWRPREAPADWLATSASWGIARQVLTPGQVRHAMRVGHDWWFRRSLVVSAVDGFSKPVAVELGQGALRDEVGDVARAAAIAVVQRGLPVGSSMSASAGMTLRAFGVVQRVPSHPSLVQQSLAKILGAHPGRVTAVRWKKLFGADHRRAEKQAVLCAAESVVNAAGYINALDVFDDWLLRALYRHDPSLGQYQLGSIGSILNSTRLKAKYPAVYTLVVEIHKKRLETYLSHPRVKATGKTTGRIRFSYIKRAATLLREAIAELSSLKI